MTDPVQNPSNGRRPKAFPKNYKPRKKGVNCLSLTKTAVKKRKNKIIKSVLLDDLSLQKAGEAAGYSKNVASQIASKTIRELSQDSPIVRMLNEEGVDLRAIAKKVAALMGAKTTKFFQHQGVVVETRDVDALETQRKSTELAARLHGVLSNESTSGVDAMAGSIMGALLALKAQAKMQAQEPPKEMGEVVEVEDKGDK